MPQGHFEETVATARLPNLDIEIVRSRSPAGDAERISICVQAVPSFEAFGRYLEAVNPFLFWMRFVQMAWAPWLGTSMAKLPEWNFSRLAPPAETAKPDSTSHREGDK